MQTIIYVIMHTRYLTSFYADELCYDICFMFDDQSDSKNSTNMATWCMVYLGIGQLIRMNRITDKRCWSFPIQVSQSSSLIDL